MKRKTRRTPATARRTQAGRDALAGTGEEWRAMDEGLGQFASEESLAVVEKARANIPKLRMREVQLRLVDRRGRPVANLPVEAVQTRPAFCFGDHLWELDAMYRFGEADTDKGKYWKLRFAEVLNAANALCYWTERPRNDGPKTEDIQGDPQLDGFARCVDWAASQGLTVKGHPLFWSIQKCVPDWVKRYDYDTQMKFAEVRVRNLVARFRGRVKIWDAVNEPMWEPAFKNLPRRHWPHLDPIADIADYIEPVLRWCRQEDPDACFLVNDYGMEESKQDGHLTAADGTRVTAALQRRRFRELLAELFRRGVPPDAIGLQQHTAGWLDHRTQWAVYDEMAEAGLPIHITEFWAHTRQLEKEGKLPPQQIQQMQADFVCNYLTCAFGHPAVEAFFFWGFMGSAVEWAERSSHELRPMFTRVRDLIHNDWTTRERLTTDRQGRVSFRAFFGDYALRYTVSPGLVRGAAFTVNPQQTMPVTLTVGLAS
jgi:endo-1,4-beta-xylanase